jgi:hypothetical protein
MDSRETNHMNSSNLFRKVAIERMSSPEQLDQLLRVTTPESWLALVAMIAFFSVVITWGFRGELATKVSCDGVLIVSEGMHDVASTGIGHAGDPINRASPGLEKLQVFLFIPSAKAKEVQPGMAAEISPSTLRREEYGFIKGKVTFVSDYPATEASLMKLLNNPPLVRMFESEGPVNEIRVEMEAAPNTISGYRWSSPRGASLKLSDGTLCAGEIVTRKQRPISLVFPYVRETLGLR